MISSQVSKMKGGYGWYAVVAHAGRERLAKFHLERQGFEVYLPMRAPLTRGSAGHPAEPRPMFPRYMFVAVDLSAPGWRAIYSTIGVASVLTTGAGETARPRPVPQGLIEALQAREVDGLVVLPERQAETPCALKPGDRARVQAGRYADLDVIFLERVDRNRAALLLSFLGRDHRVITHLGHIK